MKVLFWQRIVIPPNNEPPKGKLWLQMPEVNVENFDTLVELFSINNKKSKSELPKSQIQRKETIKILDSKRSQNVGIIMRKFDIGSIRDALYNCDEKCGLIAEDLQKIELMKATAEEMAKLSEVTEMENLDGPEKWLLDLSTINFLSDRVFCIAVQSEFGEKIHSISFKLSLVNSMCKFLTENENLKKLLAIILAVGNYLNGGSNRGQADGFQLDILKKLKDIKSNNPKVTLLYYIMQLYLEKSRKCNSLDGIESPVPDPADLDKSTTIDFEECEREMKKLFSDIESMNSITSVSKEDAQVTLPNLSELFCNYW
jgi:hypothetical protein